MSIAAMADRAFNLLVVLTRLDLVDGLGRPATFFLYAAPTALNFLFALRLVPKIERRGPEDGGEAWAERGVEAPSIL